MISWNENDIAEVLSNMYSAVMKIKHGLNIPQIDFNLEVIQSILLYCSTGRIYIYMSRLYQILASLQFLSQKTEY